VLTADAPYCYNPAFLMKTVPHLFLILLLYGCGSQAVRETPSKPPPENPGDLEPQDRPPVAFIDNRPVTWQEVVDHSMSARGRELIEKYILWKLRKEKLDELGIGNTREDLRRRAQLYVDALENQMGEAAFKKALEESKMTKASRVESLAANPEFDELLRTEKGVVTSLLTEASIEIDTVAFTDNQEAAQFAVGAARTSFGHAVERLQSASNSVGKIGYWPRHRFPRGLAPDAIAAAPALERKLFGMKKGQTTGVESAKGNILVVVHVVDVHPPDATPYANMADRVMAELLRNPPGSDRITLWMERLFKSRNIRYEDRYTPRNQDR
jgi:hypothetical protein